MGVKYVKDFDYPSSGGFHSGKMPSKARASERGMPKAVGKAMGGPMRGVAPTKPAPITYMPVTPSKGAGKEDARARLQVMMDRRRAGYAEGGRVPGNDMDRLPAKKPPGRTMDLAPSKPEKGEYAGYAKGGMSKVGKVMREYKEGKLRSGSKKGPKVKSREQAVAIALSEARKAGAKIPKKAEGGVFNDENLAYGSKKVSYRGSPKKAKMLGRQDRRAREAMERAEKYAPGLSVDMPDKKSDGGMPVHRRKPMYDGGKC